MFENLIESKRKADKKKAFGLGFVSLVGHSTVVVLAVIATLTAGQAQTGVVVDTTMVFLNQEEKKPEEQPPVLDIPQLKGFQTVVAPTDIPTNIPPINLQEHFDPKDYSGTGVEGGIGTIQGRVLVQAIIDTTGRAEPQSVKVIQSPNPGFDQSAKNYVLRALFRPARVHGRAVRVLINLPIDFKIKR